MSTAAHWMDAIMQGAGLHGNLCGSNKVCWISDFTKCIWSKVVECIFPSKWIHRTHFLSNFLAYFAGQGALKKDLTVGLDGARPANTCIPPSFRGNGHVQLCSIPAPKNTFASIKKSSKSLFYKQNKDRERVWQTHLWQQWVSQHESRLFH